MNGRPGKFTVLDAWSHCIPRVCRSSYSKELLGAEEAFGVGILRRGFIVSACNYEVVGEFSEASPAKNPLTVVALHDVQDNGEAQTQAATELRMSGLHVACWLLRMRRTSLR